MTLKLSETELVVGAALPERRFGPQTRTDIVRWFARSAGMPGVFSVGMLQAGCLGTYCVELFGPESVRRLAVRFADQVWPGDELVCRGAVCDDADRGRTCRRTRTDRRSHRRWRGRIGLRDGVDPTERDRRRKDDPMTAGNKAEVIAGRPDDVGP
jgi:hypothetical protein